MAHLIMKFDDNLYCMWSTVVDAPITRLMSRDDLEQEYRDAYGKLAMHDFNDRMERVENSGCSSCITTKENIIANNRAGDDEQKLTETEIIEKFKGLS